MTTENITLTKLTASDGTVLTNGESYGKTVYLGVGDTADHWHEISDAEYAIIQEQEAASIE